MSKLHIWLWPFKFESDDAFEAEARSLEHLYVGKDKIFRFVDADITTHGGWRHRIQTESALPTVTDVTIYVMGHTNLGSTQILSDVGGVGPKVDVFGVATLLASLFQCIHRQAPIKVKFFNCLSRFASVPRKACKEVYRRTRRPFRGYAYALSLTTSYIDPDDNVTRLPNKYAFVQTGPDATIHMRAKDVRFQIFPTKIDVQADGSTLTDFKGLLVEHAQYL